MKRSGLQLSPSKWFVSRVITQKQGFIPAFIYILTGYWGGLNSILQLRNKLRGQDGNNIFQIGKPDCSLI